MSETSASAQPKRTKRQMARIYAGAGAAFWVVAAIAAYARGAGFEAVLALAVLGFVIAVALVVSWFHEPAGAVIMLAGAAATVAYGVLRRWDLPFWAMMLAAAIGPLLLAAYLFDAARRDSTQA